MQDERWANAAGIRLAGPWGSQEAGILGGVRRKSGVSIGAIKRRRQAATATETEFAIAARSKG